MSCEHLIEGCRVKIDEADDLHPGQMGTLGHPVEGGRHAVLVDAEEEETIINDDLLTPV